jgi:hypothetical protein
LFTKVGLKRLMDGFAVNNRHFNRALTYLPTVVSFEKSNLKQVKTIRLFRLADIARPTTTFARQTL